MPGAADVTGTANAAATVSVNNQVTARKGDYFYKELAIDNSVSPAYAQVNVVGARSNYGAGGEDAVTQKGGRIFVAQTLEAFNHDLDGNLISDGRWIFSWDAENRLISMETIPGVPVEAKQRLEFSYDYMSRRIQKKVYSWNVPTSTYQLQFTTNFVYDGWNLVAEIDGSNTLVRSYVRGTGELLLVSGGGTSYQVGYDGNENVVALVKASTGTVSASYDYDPFGQSLKLIGEFAGQNPFRFSGEYTDAESGLSYYGHRYYSPQLGRWLNRDPNEERGGLNLGGFLANDPINAVDYLGLWKRDGEWAGSWYRYSGTAIAECKDKLSELADLITGDPNDWKALGIPENVKEGQRVNIAPLLRVFEDKLRYSIVKATGHFKAEFGMSDSIGPSATATVNTFFGSTRVGTADCTDAFLLVYSKGLIDVLKSNEFDDLGLTYRSIPLVEKRGTPGQMLLGDGGFVANYTDYLRLHPGGGYQGENIIKVGSGRFWGFGTEIPVRSIRQWEEELRRAYNEGLSVGRTDPLPGFTGNILFFNTSKLGMNIFDLRNWKKGH